MLRIVRNPKYSSEFYIKLCFKPFLSSFNFTEYFSDIDSMLNDLTKENVDGVLVDLFSMVEYKETLQRRKLKVITIIDTNTAFGIILSGKARALQRDLESLLLSKQDIILNYKKSIEDKMPVRSML